MSAQTVEREANGRETALAESGWGRGFRLWQPRNLCFYVVLLGWVGGTEAAVKYFSTDIAAYSTAFGVGLVAFAIYAIPWWLYLSHLNRMVIVPRRAIGVGFIWGAVAATFWIALPANNALLSLYGKAFGQNWVQNYAAGLAAPFTEETAKMLGLILLIGLARTVIRTPFHGFILGAFIGLGFQVGEDLLYAFQGGIRDFGVDQVGAALKVLGERGLAGLFSHTMFSAIYCAGLIWLLNRDGSGHRARGLGLMVLATFFHGTWDTGGSYLYSVMNPVGALVVNYALTIVLSLTTIRLLQRTVEREATTWISAVLQPDVDLGVLTGPEATAVAGQRKARKQFRRSLHGHHNKNIGRHIITAGEDLAEAIAHAGGADTPEVLHARSEVQRIREGRPAHELA